MILLGVTLSVVLTVAVGLVVSRKVKGDSENYLVAGRGLGATLTGAALMGQAVDANATLGNTDLAASFGFWAGAALPVGLALCLVLTGLFVAKPMNRLGLLTLPDFYRRRYGRGIEVPAAALMILAFCLLLAGNLVAGGFLLERFLGVSYAVGVLLIVGLLLTYTVAGGMISGVYTAVVQMVMSLAAAVALLVWVAMQHGLDIPAGVGPLDLGQLTDPAQGATINWATLVALGVGDIVAIDFMQRIFCARSPEAARRACFAGAAGTLMVGIPFSLVALVAAGVVGDAEGPVLYALLADHAPVWLAVLVLAGIVGASFSTANGAILGTAAVAVRNILGVTRGDLAGPDRLLRATRIATVPVVVLGVLFALEVPQTGILLTLAFDLLLAALVVPFLLGLFWGGSTAAAAGAAMLAGTVVRLVLFALTPTVYGVPNGLLHVPNDLVGPGFDGWPTFLAALSSLAAFVAVARVTRRPAVALPQQVAAVPATVAGTPA